MTDKDSRLTRGADETIRMEVIGEPADEWDGLAGADVWWVLTDEREGGDVIIEKTSSDSAVTVDEDGGGTDPGVVYVDLDANETESLTNDEYYQEVVVRDSTGNVSADPLDPYVLRVRESSISEVV